MRLNYNEWKVLRDGMMNHRAKLHRDKQAVIDQLGRNDPDRTAFDDALIEAVDTALIQIANADNGLYGP